MDLIALNFVLKCLTRHDAQNGTSSFFGKENMKVNEGKLPLVLQAFCPNFKHFLVIVCYAGNIEFNAILGAKI